MVTNSRVLLVEDDAFTARSIVSSLERAGYVVTGVASTAAEALTVVGNSPPDVILMDIRIKGPVDGVQTAELIRDRFPIPIIFLTGLADEDTLGRAKIAEPFGYLVKPVSDESLVTAIEVALYKHSIGRKLEEHRAWLETILQTSAEGIIVTDNRGCIQFVNRAAENLTGLMQIHVRDKMLDDVLSIRSLGAKLSPRVLLSRAITEGRPVPVPHDAFLRRGSADIAISGQFAVSVNENGHAVGGVITLHDATAQKLEEQQIRQEQKISLVGHFAEGVARDFDGLLDLISEGAGDLEKRLAGQPHFADKEDFEQDVSGIQQSAEIALTISRLLLNLSNSKPASPELLKMDVLAVESRPLLQQLAGGGIDFSIDCAQDVGLVFGDRNQMVQLLVNLVLNAKERLAEKGTIRIAFDNTTTDRAFLRIRITVEKSSDADQAWSALAFPFQMESPPLSLSLVAAIVAAAEGFICSSTLNENSNEVEVLLPRRESTTEKSVLLVGLDVTVGSVVNAGLKRLGYRVFEAKSNKEALLVASLYAGQITAVIIDGSAASKRSRNVLKARLSDQHKAAVLLQLAFDAEATGDGWRTLVKPIQVLEIVAAIEIGSRGPDLKRLAATLR